LEIKLAFNLDCGGRIQLGLFADQSVSVSTSKLAFSAHGHHTVPTATNFTLCIPLPVSHQLKGRRYEHENQPHFPKRMGLRSHRHFLRSDFIDSEFRQWRCEDFYQPANSTATGMYLSGTVGVAMGRIESPITVAEVPGRK
jgi:hypothetical protein